MIYYLKEIAPDTFERVTEAYAHDEITHPFANLALYTGEQLADIGLHAVTLREADEGQRITSSSFARVDGEVVNVVEQEPIPVLVPDSVSSAQAAIALDRAGLYDTALAAITSSGNREAKFWFERAQAWERSNPYVASLAALLGLDDAEVDELFVKAAKVA